MRFSGRTSDIAISRGLKQFRRCCTPAVMSVDGGSMEHLMKFVISRVVKGHERQTKDLYELHRPHQAKMLKRLITFEGIMLRS